MASGGDRTPPYRVTRSLFYGKKQSESESSLQAERREEEEVDDVGLSGESFRDISYDSDDSVTDPNYRVLPEDRDLLQEEPVASTSEASTGVTGVSVGDVGEGSGGVGDESRSRGHGRGRERAGTRGKKGRKQVRGLSADEAVKKKRNLGQEYVSYRSGKTVQARRVGSPCKDGCFDRVCEEARNTILKNFWAIGNYNEQNSYIAQFVKPVPVKRRYGRGKHAVERKNFEYTVKYLNETFKICRVAFMHIHDISNTRLQLQMKRMRLSESGTSPGDKRGRHGTEPKLKITGARLDRVHEHIMSLPTTSSHYTRAKSPHRQYLDDCTSVKELYEKYTYWMTEKGYEEEPVKLEYYRKIFAQDYNISFKPPKQDTCSTCDEIQATMQQKQAAGEDVSELQATLDQHKDLAKEAQTLLGSQVDYVPTEGEPIVKSIAMDLQQTLPCPRISTGLAYYLRKLWVYNFCIHDIKKGKGTMFVWDEATGGRGSDEVASCLIRWIKLCQD